MQKCHVLPTRHGGGREDNLIPLCPTHHFLFDHNRLSPDEFAQIDFENIDGRSIEYFEKVILEDHRLLWARDKMVKEGELLPCTVCGEYPEIFEYPPTSFQPELQGLTVPDNPPTEISSWVCCKCFLNSWEFVGSDREALRKKAANSWNAGERRNRWDSTIAAINIAEAVREGKDFEIIQEKDVDRKALYIDVEGYTGKQVELEFQEYSENRILVIYKHRKNL